MDTLSKRLLNVSSIATDWRSPPQPEKFLTAVDGYVAASRFYFNFRLIQVILFLVRCLKTLFQSIAAVIGKVELGSLMEMCVGTTDLGTSSLWSEEGGEETENGVHVLPPSPPPLPTSYQSPAFACTTVYSIMGKHFPLNLLGYYIVTFDFPPK